MIKENKIRHTSISNPPLPPFLKVGGYFPTRTSEETIFKIWNKILYYAMKTVSIKKGSIIIYRLFDVADEINLSLVESKIKEGARRMRLSKYPYMKALEFTNPPVSFVMPGFMKYLFGRDIAIHVVAKAFDFGVISLAFDIPVPEGTTFYDLEAAAQSLDTDEAFEEKAWEYIKQLVNNLDDAVIHSSIKDDYTEDYMIFLVQQMDKEIDIPDFFHEYDPSRLLLYETRPLSQHTREETLRHRFSYYPDDLVIVHLDNAFVIEPSGSSDIIDILEFANAQILELIYYDHVLDKQLAWIYSELSKRKSVSTFRLRDYERLAKKITEIVTELTEVTEKVDNALKVTEDVYYARIYRTAMMLFRSRDWELSIKEKLQVVTNTSKMIYDEISTKRGHFLEIGILLLIAIEIVLILIIEW